MYTEETNMYQRDHIFLKKWLTILFWLIIPSTIAGFMTQESVAASAPGLYSFGQILKTLSALAYSAILLVLAKAHQNYRVAGACGIIVSILNYVSSLLAVPFLTVVFSILIIILGLAGEYQEYTAHAQVVAPWDSVLAEKWYTLWKWYIGSMIAALASIVLMLIIPLLGALATIVSVIAAAVVSIIKLVYLYRTGRAINCPVEEALPY